MHFDNIFRMKILMQLWEKLNDCVLFEYLFDGLLHDDGLIMICCSTEISKSNRKQKTQSINCHRVASIKGGNVMNLNPSSLSEGTFFITDRSFALSNIMLAHRAIIMNVVVAFLHRYKFGTRFKINLTFRQCSPCMQHLVNVVELFHSPGGKKYRCFWLDGAASWFWMLVFIYK